MILYAPLIGGIVLVAILVALACDRYGQRRGAAAPLVDDSTREVTAIRASWQHVQERQSRPLPPAPYRLETDTDPAMAVVAVGGRHRAA